MAKHWPGISPMTLMPSEKDQAWSDAFNRSCGHQAFEPSPVQRAFMDVVADSLAQGRGTLGQLSKDAVSTLQISRDLFDSTESGVDGQWLGMMVFKAKEAVQAEQKWVQTKSVAQSLRLSVGDELGTLIASDRKMCTACKVAAIDEGGTVYTVHGKRGTSAISFTTSALGLKDAIDGAYQAGKRKTSHLDFVQRRAHLPETSVIADPREPYYKDAITLARDQAQAAELIKQVKQWQAASLDFSSKGEPGSFDSLYGFVAHGFALIAQAEAELLGLRCGGGGPSSEYQAKVTQLEWAKELTEGRFMPELERCFPDWRKLLEDLGDAGDSAISAGGHSPDPAAAERGLLTHMNDESQEAQLARQINHHICEKVVKDLVKSGEREMSVGGRTQEWLDERIRQTRSDWSTTQLDAHVLSLAKAILERDADVLIRRWAKDGHGVYGNEGSLSAFRSITGLNLLRMSSADRAQALYEWADWTPAQITAHRAKLADERIARKVEQLRAERHKQREDIVRGALLQTIVDDDGSHVPVKWLLDKRITSGFDSVQVDVGHGVGKVRLCNKPLSQHISLPKGVISDYVQIALDLRDEAVERQRCSCHLDANSLESDDELSSSESADLLSPSP